MSVSDGPLSNHCLTLEIENTILPLISLSANSRDRDLCSLQLHVVVWSIGKILHSWT